jgi:hypothetical protein
MQKRKRKDSKNNSITKKEQERNNVSTNYLENIQQMSMISPYLSIINLNLNVTGLIV